jgi:hypothetical protein
MGSKRRRNMRRPRLYGHQRRAHARESRGHATCVDAPAPALAQLMTTRSQTRMHMHARTRVIACPHHCICTGAPAFTTGIFCSGYPGLPIPQRGQGTSSAGEHAPWHLYRRGRIRTGAAGNCCSVNPSPRGLPYRSSIPHERRRSSVCPTTLSLVALWLQD